MPRRHRQLFTVATPRHRQLFFARHFVADAGCSGRTGMQRSASSTMCGPMSCIFGLCTLGIDEREPW